MTPVSEPIPPEAWKGLQRALALYLFAPNVALIDVGYRILDQRRQLAEQLCVRVHVREKPRGAAFEAFREDYPEQVIDAEQIGFPVDIPQASYKAQPLDAAPASPWRGYAFTPMYGGVSISNELSRGYGTLGGLVVDRATGAPMILSNWHVLAGDWHIGEGAAIFQPGVGDGGYGPYAVAQLSRSSIDQMLDAAVAALSGQRPLLNEQLELGPVAGVREPQLGMRVTKSGRRTGVTEGLIAGVGGRQVMGYRTGQQVIREVVHITSLDGCQVSAPGDSGSWWIEQASRCAVGLHFAGSDDPEYALAIAMPAVLEALAVDVVTAAASAPGPALIRR